MSFGKPSSKYRVTEPPRTIILDQTDDRLAGISNRSREVVQIIFERVRESELLFPNVQLWTVEDGRTQVVELSDQAAEFPYTITLVERFIPYPVYPSVHLVLHPSDLDQRLAIRHPVIRGAAGHYSTKALVESGKVAELATKLADADERFGTS